MDATSRALVTLRRVTAMAEIAEVAKFAAKAGYSLSMMHESLVDDDDREASGLRLVLERERDQWLGEELAWLVYLQAFSQSRSARQVLADIAAKLERMCAPLDVPPQDVEGIGEARHEHDDED